LAGQPNVAGVPWAGIDPVVNNTGDVMALGFTEDFVARSTAALSFTADAYPGLRENLLKDPNFLEKLGDPFALLDMAFDFYIQAAATPMTSAEYLQFQTDTAERLRTKVLADPTAPAGLLTLAARRGR
jgi:hypothetical protein